MPERTIAIGDIHGCAAALSGLLRLLEPGPADTIVTVGDYVDRGSDSRGVIELLIDLEKRCTLIPLLGNHDEMMLRAPEDEEAWADWMEFGGIACLQSYGFRGDLADVPAEHWAFLRRCREWHETARHFFVHGNYDPALPLEEQPRHVLRWHSLEGRLPDPHPSGRIAVLGHTPQRRVLDLGHLVCIDTGCGFGGHLSAIDLDRGTIWRVNERGEKPPLD